MTSLYKYFSDINRGAQRLLTTVVLLLSTVALIAILASWWSFNHPAEDERPGVMTAGQKQQLCGWAGEDLARQEGARLAKQFVPFLVSESNGKEWVTEDRRSVLWDAPLKIMGRHIPTKKQEIGDCVSFGAATACEYLLAVQIAAGSPQEWHEVFPPWIYGGSRVIVGKGRLGCRSDGSIGAWAAAFLITDGGWGALPSDTTGVPSYSGSIAKKWGCDGPPKQFAEFAKPNVLRSAAKVTTWQEVRDAIVNGYPVTIASNVGFEGRAYERGGKLFRDPRGSWGHQMCVIGYDNAPEPCFFIMNSWGEVWCEKPIDGAPAGGFWTKASAIQRIVSQDDSYAFSDAQGFPARQWDVILSGPDTGEDSHDLDRIRVRHARTAEARPNVRSDFAIAP